MIHLRAALLARQETSDITQMWAATGASLVRQSFGKIF